MPVLIGITKYEIELIRIQGITKKVRSGELLPFAEACIDIHTEFKNGDKEKGWRLLICIVDSFEKWYDITGSR